MSISEEVFDRDPSLDARAFELQRTFRVLLDCMARPGEVGCLEAGEAVEADAARAGLLPATLMIADVLLDAGTTFAVATEGDEAASLVARRSHAVRAEADAAAYVLLADSVRDEAAGRLVRSLAEGTLEDPQRGATCVVECSALLGRGADGSCVGSVSSAREMGAWHLEGPGVDGTSRIQHDRVDVMRAREERHDEFPLGIDLVFVDGAGHVACVPRSSLAKEAQPWDM